MPLAFQVSLKISTNTPSSSKAVEKVANIVMRHRNVERLYLVKEYELTTQLQDHIMDISALALNFLVKGKK